MVDEEPKPEKVTRKERRAQAKASQKTYMPKEWQSQKVMLQTMNKAKWEVEQDMRNEDDNVLQIAMITAFIALLFAIYTQPDFQEFMFEDGQFFFPSVVFYIYAMKRLGVYARVQFNPDPEQRKWDLVETKIRAIDTWYNNLDIDDLTKAMRKIGLGSGKWLEDDEVAKDMIEGAPEAT